MDNSSKTQKKPRCPKGTHRNKTTGRCVSVKGKAKAKAKQTRKVSPPKPKSVSPVQTHDSPKTTKCPPGQKLVTRCVSSDWSLPELPKLQTLQPSFKPRTPDESPPKSDEAHKFDKTLTEEEQEWYNEYLKTLQPSFSPSTPDESPLTLQPSFSPSTPDESPPRSAKSLIVQQQQPTRTIKSLLTPKQPTQGKKKRCPKGYVRKPPKTGECVPNQLSKMIPQEHRDKVASQIVQTGLKEGYKSFSPEINKLVIESMNPDSLTKKSKHVGECSKDLVAATNLKALPTIYIPIPDPYAVKGKCVKYYSAQAQEALLKDLAITSAKTIDVSKIIAPRQLESNCWFNTMFVCFFISDKGRKFFRYARQLMIEGKRISSVEKVGGKVVVKKSSIMPLAFRHSLAWLNLGISACLNGEPKVKLFDTNGIIKNIAEAVPDFPKYKEHGNPLRAYKFLTYSLYSNMSDREKYTSHISPVLFYVQEDIDFYKKYGPGRYAEDYIKKFEDEYKPPDILAYEILEKQTTYIKKEKEFTLPTGEKYVLDSAILRDTGKAHFMCTLTINGDEYAFDGASFRRMTPFKWKHLLNSTKKITLQDDNPKLSTQYFSFSDPEGYVMLFYYRV
jgi:hypothetical protein